MELQRLKFNERAEYARRNGGRGERERKREGSVLVQCSCRLVNKGEEGMKQKRLDRELICD